MTLDEAIKYAEKVAKAKEREAKINRNHGGWAYDNEATKCSACAEEHRQLAEWLKDYKRLLEQEPFMNKPCVANQMCHEDKVKVLDKIRAEIMDFEEELFHRPNTDYTDYAAVRYCVQIIDKYREPTGAESEECTQDDNT